MSRASAVFAILVSSSSILSYIIDSASDFYNFEIYLLFVGMNLKQVKESYWNPSS